jgi:hypothetical protein
LYSEELAAEDHRRLTAILDRYGPRNGLEKARIDLLSGAAAVLGNRPEEGMRTLRQLIGEIRTGEAPWGQEHLPWYYLGRGQEKAGRNEDSRRSYLKALDLVPNHLPSIRRLAALRSEGVALLARLQPAVNLEIPFGGGITLLGYSLERSAPEHPRGGSSITLFWQFTERTETRYKPMIRIGGYSGNPVFSNRSVIVKDTMPYPHEAPKSGEVVTETYQLPTNSMPGLYLKAALMVAGSSQSLYHDLGNGFIALALK